MIWLVCVFWLLGILGALELVRDRGRVEGAPLDRDERILAFVVAAVWPMLLVAAGVAVVVAVIVRGAREAL